jgi:hypothetical protein
MDENKQFDVIGYYEGAFGEEIPWEIHANITVWHGELDDALALRPEIVRPCMHCRSVVETVVGKRYLTWICPHVVFAYNEGGFNLTKVCLQCIVDAYNREVLKGVK